METYLSHHRKLLYVAKRLLRRLQRLRTKPYGLAHFGMIYGIINLFTHSARPLLLGSAVRKTSTNTGQQNTEKHTVVSRVRFESMTTIFER